MMPRGELLRRYRDLRAIGMRHHGAALKFLARSAILDHARRLGLLAGQTLIADSEAELTLVFDLAIYPAKDGRSRAIDRYAKVAQLPPDSDEMFIAFIILREAAIEPEPCEAALNDPGETRDLE